MQRFIVLARRLRLPPNAAQFLDWLELNPDSITADRIKATIEKHGPNIVANSLRPFKLNEWLAAEDKSTYRDTMPIVVYGAWSIPTDEGKLYCDFPDSIVRVADLSEARPLAEGDFSPYNGPHPRKCHGSPLPVALYAAFNLFKATESALSERLIVRVRPEEKAVIEGKAKDAGLSLSDYVRQALL